MKLLCPSPKQPSRIPKSMCPCTKRLNVILAVLFSCRYKSVTELVKSWYDEKYSFSYPNRCTGSVCSHYTQVRFTHEIPRSIKEVALTSETVLRGHENPSTHVFLLSLVSHFKQYITYKMAARLGSLQGVSGSNTGTFLAQNGCKTPIVLMDFERHTSSFFFFFGSYFMSTILWPWKEQQCVNRKKKVFCPTKITTQWCYREKRFLVVFPWKMTCY